MTQRNESARWKTDYWKSLKQNRKKNEKWGQFKRPLRQHRKYQHYIIGIPKEEREKGAGNIHEDITAEKFPNLKENRHLTKGSTERHRKLPPSTQPGIVSCDLNLAAWPQSPHAQPCSLTILLCIFKSNGSKSFGSWFSITDFLTFLSSYLFSYKTATIINIISNCVSFESDFICI